MKAETIISKLGLEPHPNEGGYFKRTYESKSFTDTSVGERRLLTSIYYMLTADDPIGCFHRNKSDIIHYHHCGGSIDYFILSDSGEFKEITLGSNVLEGEVPQFTVNAGDWKASRLNQGDFGLISEAVSPGFEYEDNEIATYDAMKPLFEKIDIDLLNYVKQN